MPWWVVPLALLALPAAALAVYGDLLVKGPALSASSDIIAQHLSTKQVLYRSLRAGHGIPFWRDDELSGAPALTHPQSLYTYPLHFLFYLMPPEQAVGPTLWLHFLAAGVTFYVLGAALGLGQGARLVMGLAGMFNYKLMAITYAGWLPVIPGLVFVPLLIAAVLHALRKPGPAAALGVALSGAVCLHTGHLQLFYYAVLFLVPYVVVRTFLDRRAGNGLRARRAWVSLSAGALLASGAAAYLLVPMTAEARLISRGQATYDFFLSGHALKLAQLWSLVTIAGAESKLEFWEDVGYFGLIPLLLAAVGAVLGRRQSPAGFLAASFIVSLLLTMDTPLLRAGFALVPGFSLFRNPARFLFLTSIFGIALAGLGVQELTGLLRAHLKQPAWATGLPMAVALILVLGAHGHAVRLLGVRPWFEGVEPLAGIDPLPEADYLKALAPGESPFRVAPVMRPTINYGWAASRELQLITGFDAYNFRHYQTYMDLLRAGRPLGAVPRVWTDVLSLARPDLLDGLNVKYVVMPGEAQGTAQLQLVGHFRKQPAFVLYEGMIPIDITVLRNVSARPRAWWARDVVSTASEADMLAAARANDLRETAVVLGPGGPEIQAAPADAVEVVEQRDGYLALDVATENERFLVLSEVWHPGWQARLDGAAVDILRTNVALLGVWAPPGKHRLVLEFRPMYWGLACAASLTAGVLVAGLAAYVLFPRKDLGGGT